MENLTLRKNYDLNNEMLKDNKEFIKNLSNEELKKIIIELENKKNDLTIKQNSKKNLINSLSGALGNEKFPLYDTRLSSAMTGYGRFYIKFISTNISKYLKEKYDYQDEDVLVYIHTDSIFLNLDPIIKNLDKNQTKIILDEILEYINKQFIFFKIIFNSNENVLKMKFENLYKKAIWCSSSNYFAKDKNNNLKVVGLTLMENVVPKFVREKVDNLLNLYLENKQDNIKNFINKIKNDFYKENINKIVFNENIGEINNVFVDYKYKLNILDSLNKLFFKNQSFKIYEIENLILIGKIDLNKIKIILDKIFKENDKDYKIFINQIENFNENIYKNDFYEEGLYFKKNTRDSIKGAILFNKYIEKNSLNIEKINSFDKIHYLYLKEKNPFNSKVISFKYIEDINNMDIEKYIDYDLQFEKGFYKPLEQITNILNVKKSDFEDFDSLF